MATRSDNLATSVDVLSQQERALVADALLLKRASIERAITAATKSNDTELASVYAARVDQVIALHNKFR